MVVKKFVRSFGNTAQRNDTQYNNKKHHTKQNYIQRKTQYAECFTFYFNGECRNVECCYAECHDAERRSCWVLLFYVMLSVFLLSVLFSVFMLSVLC